ncbi:MAG: Rieske (2Fe-2S) protein [Planctomycetota bacterium]|nr:MAG: Rieske (2Fe-2S) protein [Planctomycetota bacterium]
MGLPGVRYLLGAMNRSADHEALVRRVARLDALPIGRPVLITITGRKQDGWATYSEQPLGRVWLLRRGGESSADDGSAVLALSATCPHLGCTVGMARDGAAFECPCHRAAFAFDGRRLSRQDGTPNHAPRDLDALPVRLVRDEASGTTWVEVTYVARPTGGNA